MDEVSAAKVYAMRREESKTTPWMRVFSPISVGASKTMDNLVQECMTLVTKSAFGLERKQSDTSKQIVIIIKKRVMMSGRVTDFKYSTR